MPSHYLNQCWFIVNWTLTNKLQWNFNRNSSIFIQENGIENVVWKMVAILSCPQCVNPSGASPISIRDPNFMINMLTYATNRLSNNYKIDMFSSKFHMLSWFLITFCWPDDIIQNGQKRTCKISQHYNFTKPDGMTSCYFCSDKKPRHVQTYFQTLW